MGALHPPRRPEAAPARPPGPSPRLSPRLSIVIPTLDEAALIEGCLLPLQPLREAGCEVLVADGGSRDATAALAAPLADRVLQAPRGRAAQMNAGALAARAPVLLFLHADTRLPPGAVAAVLEGLAASGRGWGRFEVRLDGSHPLLRVVERAMGLRSRLTGICTGDQALFVERELFWRVGGYPPIPLMEDVALSRLLKRAAGRPLCLGLAVRTSARRWEGEGVLRTIGLMWALRAAYALGADPARLHRLYYGRPPGPGPDTPGEAREEA